MKLIIVKNHLLICLKGVKAEKTNTGATSAISTLKNPSKASTLVLRKGELQQINKNATKYL